MKKFGLIAAGVVAFIAITQPFFIVNQTQQAIVLQFGQQKYVYSTPGLKMKIPFIQDVVYYEKRVLEYDLEPISITTADQKRLFVDTFTRYKIKDPLLFFQSIKPATEIGARMRLDAFVSSTVRNVLGKIPLRDLLSEKRSSIMHTIEQEIKRLCADLGILIVDVRIVRAELPPENRKAVFARMNAQLDRIAKENRAKGSEIAQKIKAEADKDREILIANAESSAQILKGKAEAEAIQIVSAAANLYPQFYSFYRSLKLYEKAFATGESTFILGTQSELLKNLTDNH